MKNCCHDCGFECTTLNLRSQSGAFDHLTMATPGRWLDRISKQRPGINHNSGQVQILLPPKNLNSRMQKYYSRLAFSNDRSYPKGFIKFSSFGAIKLVLSKSEKK